MDEARLSMQAHQRPVQSTLTSEGTEETSMTGAEIPAYTDAHNQAPNHI